MSTVLRKAASTFVKVTRLLVSSLQQDCVQELRDRLSKYLRSFWTLRMQIHTNRTSIYEKTKGAKYLYLVITYNGHFRVWNSCRTIYWVSNCQLANHAKLKLSERHSILIIARRNSRWNKEGYLW